MPVNLGLIAGIRDVPTKQYVDSRIGDWNTVSISSNYTASDRDRIFANTASNVITVTTPSSGMFRIVDRVGNLPTAGFAVNNLTVVPSDSNTIMGATSFVLNVGAIAVFFQLIGTDWRLIN